MWLKNVLYRISVGADTGRVWNIWRLFVAVGALKGCCYGPVRPHNSKNAGEPPADWRFGLRHMLRNKFVLPRSSLVDVEED